MTILPPCANLNPIVTESKWFILLIVFCERRCKKEVFPSLVDHTLRRSKKSLLLLVEESWRLQQTPFQCNCNWENNFYPVFFTIMCIRVCACTCMCVHAYVRVSICVPACKCVCVCMHVCECLFACVCMHMYMQVQMCVHVYLCVHACEWVCLCVHVHTRMHTCIRMPWHVCEVRGQHWGLFPLQVQGIKLRSSELHSRHFQPRSHLACPWQS